MNRRNFFIGSIAVPFGATLPAAIAAELALPPPEQPKVGESLIVTQVHDHVLVAEDLMEGNATFTLVNRGGTVMGRFMLTEVQHSAEREVVDLTVLGSAGQRSFPGLYRTNLTMVMREIDRPLRSPFTR